MTERSELPLFAHLFETEAMHAVFSDRARIQGMLDFEAALARAESACGVIPESAVSPIAAHCHAELYAHAPLGSAAALAGNVAIPLVRALTERVASTDPIAAGFVHWGATSQDAIDTGLMLQLRQALDIIGRDLRTLLAALVECAVRERATLMSGRTWLQQAVPVTFGLKAAGWLDALVRHDKRLRALKGSLVLQFGGAAGTLAALGSSGDAVARAMSRELGLVLPEIPWHAERDRVAEVGCVLGLLVGTLGKMARDLSLLMQTEVGEAFEPGAPGRGGSSTMPHKRNPVGCAHVLAAAQRVPGLVGTLLTAMVQEHERGLGGWHAEWEVLPEVCRLAAGAVAQTLGMVSGLELDAQRMAHNLAAGGGLYMSESVAMSLAVDIGLAPAHRLIEQSVQEAVASRRSLRAVLLESAEVSAHLSAEALDILLDPRAYLGSATGFIDAVVERARRALETEGS